MSNRFANRAQAGSVLAGMLQHYAGRPDVIALGLPRGGVPVAFEVAEQLGVRLDVFLVRKLGAPFHAELALGAIASGGICYLNEQVIEALRASPQVIDRVIKREREELQRRERDFRESSAPLDLRGRIVILIDDGLATGASMRVAILAVKEHHPLRVVVAVPVGARETIEELKHHVHDVVCAWTPEDFSAVGQWYEDFSQIGDDEVRDLLARARQGSRNIAAHSPLL